MGSDCPFLDGLLSAVDGLPNESFAVNQTGSSVNAAFADQGGNLCSLEGTYDGREFRGVITVEDPDSERTIVVEAIGSGQEVGGRRNVDGTLFVLADSQGICDGAKVGFWVTIQGDVEPPRFIELCPPVDIVFIMDTSGSMSDEGFALCNTITGIRQDLLDRGLRQIRVTLLGIPESASFGHGNFEGAGSDFFCLTDSVYNLMGGDGEIHPEVPGNPPDPVTFDGDFIDPRILNPFESEADEYWAAATALIAERFAWTPNLIGQPPTVRIIVPISDESPQTGNDTCQPVDTAAIENAATVAAQNRVIVSPIIAQEPGLDPCIIALGQLLADRTGGILTLSQDAAEQLPQAIVDIVEAACEQFLVPSNGTNGAAN